MSEPEAPSAEAIAAQTLADKVQDVYAKRGEMRGASDDALHLANVTHGLAAGYVSAVSASVDSSDTDPAEPAPSVMSIDDALAIQYDAGIPYPSLAIFRAAARALKAAELAFRDAQQVYAEAVKRLSEEAVK